MIQNAKNKEDFKKICEILKFFSFDQFILIVRTIVIIKFFYFISQKFFVIFSKVYFNFLFKIFAKKKCLNVHFLKFNFFFKFFLPLVVFYFFFKTITINYLEKKISSTIF